jgi:hypothetical protein
MAFGKHTRSKEELEAFESYAWRLHVERAEKKMCLVPPRGTPLGDVHFLGAVENTMTAGLVKCETCGELKQELAIGLTGSCEACWQKTGG